VVYDVAGPKHPDFVVDAVKPVVGNIVGEEQCNPGEWVVGRQAGAAGAWLLAELVVTGEDMEGRSF
jgi:hypothetical protein